MSRAISLDLTRVLLWGGAAALAYVFYSPYARAEPLASAETLALRTVRALATLPASVVQLAGASTEQGAVAVGAGVQATLHAACARAELPASAWPVLILEPRTATPKAPGSASASPAGAEAGVLCQNADWLFLLALTPPPLDAPASMQGSPATPASTPAQLEVWGWPRDPEGRLRTVFCVREQKSLSTRNLTRRYLGRERMPQPGMSAPGPGQTDSEYWGLDNQFWRPLPD